MVRLDGPGPSAGSNSSRSTFGSGRFGTGNTRLTRCRPPGRWIPPRPLLTDKKRRPATEPAGRESHPRTARPSSGSAEPNKAADPATRRRLVDVSSITSRRETLASTHPNCPRAMAAAMRTFSSSFRSVASAEVTSVLISMTSKLRLAECHARMSMDPEARTPPYVTSTRASQPSNPRRPTMVEATNA
jgi:hypothetical protein